MAAAEKKPRPVEIGVVALKEDLHEILHEVSEGAEYDIVHGHRRRKHARLRPPKKKESDE